MTENLISLKYNCHNTNIIVLKVDKHSFKLKHFKHSLLVDFFNDLDKFSRLKRKTENKQTNKKKKKKERKKAKVNDTASELYNYLLEIYYIFMNIIIYQMLKKENGP